MKKTNSLIVALGYGLPPFYALHVWAWKHNPHGTFVNWNPNVSCERYAPAAP